MKLTTKGRYAVNALLDLTLYGTQKPVKVADLAKRQGISQAYLERLTLLLKNNGLLKSTKGPGGGYRLSRSPDSISIADVILAVESPIDVTQCKGKSNCRHGTKCLTHHLWSELNNEIFNFLSQLSLKQLASRSQTLGLEIHSQSLSLSDEAIL